MEEGPGHADGPGDVQLVRIVEDFCLDGGRRVLGAEAVGPDTVPDMGGEALRKTVVQQEAIRLFRPHPGVAEAGVLELLRPPDVVEQAGGDEHVPVRRRLCPGDLQGQVQYPADMLGVVGGIAHAGAHILAEQREVLLFHGQLLWQS